MTSITTRAGKGTPLTHTEVDDNFTNLNADKLEASNNLSDVSSASAARTNLGLGTAATTASTDYATSAQGSLADSAVQPNDSPTFTATTLTGRFTLPTATYHYSSDGKPRLYYYENGDTLFRTADGFQFRNNANTTIAQIQDTGAISTISTVTATSFIGDGSALTGLPAGYADADVDTHLNTGTATTDQVLTWTGSDYDWAEAAGGGATGGGSDKIFVENGQVVTTNYTVTATTNAMTTGPIDINSGVTVTVETGGRWVVI